MLQSIQEEMKYAHKNHQFHSKYATYLLTPQQYQQAQKQNWTMSHQVQVMKQNLIDYNVTIGVVEEMTRSMELIQQLIDPLHQADRFFGRYGSNRGGSDAASNTTTTTSSTASSTTRSKNISPLSSTLILQTLQATDRQTYERILHYVKWEQEITDFAMALHQVQYQTMQELHGKTQ